MEEASSLKTPLVSESVPSPEDDAGDLPPPSDPSLWQVCVLITLAISCVQFAGGHLLAEFLKFNGWLDDNVATLLNIGISLGILFYTLIEVLVDVFSVSFRGKNYGPWPLLVYRVQWFKKHDNFFSQAIASAILLLEEGFGIFDAPAIDTQETAVVMRIQRRISVDYRGDYEEWIREAIEEVEHFGGEQLGSEWRVPKRVHRSTTQQRAIRAAISMSPQKFKSRLLESKESKRRTGIQNSLGLQSLDENVDDETGAITHTNNIRFWSLGALDLWLSSPKYLSMTQHLTPMLESPDIIRVSRDNSTQHEDILLPKKWKVWMINSFGFYFSVLWTTTYFAPHYLKKWGVSRSGKVCEILVMNLVIDFMGFYLFTPFLELIFNAWLIRKPYEKTTSEPWRTLNDGFSKLWMKITLLVLLYGGLIVWRAAKGDWGLPGN